MVFKYDPEHVIGLPLKPVCCLPDGSDRVYFRGSRRKVYFKPESLPRWNRGKVVDHLEPGVLILPKVYSA